MSRGRGFLPRRHAARLLFALGIAVIFAMSARAGQVFDPTRPAAGAGKASGHGESAAPADPLDLSFVATGAQRRIAVVNGHVVREGDSVAGARVTRIASGMVVLNRDGRRVVLHTSKKNIRKTPVRGSGENER